MKKETIRLVQLKNNQARAVALVREPNLVLIRDVASIYDLALSAINEGQSLTERILANLSETKMNYGRVYRGESQWQLLPSFDHPRNPFYCLVSGTGLTHKNSALNRQMMHKSGEDKPTDSMAMYQLGVEGGNPKKGKIGVQPEWFYKGNGAVLKAHGETLEVPAYANDGGEEPELAGVYIVDKNGIPFRVGLTTGNEFSDHIMEKKNYLYLAPSKLRQCAIGPELVIDTGFSNIRGKVGVYRNGEMEWETDIKTGEANLAHNLANLEYHHFKYAGHRLPLQAHVHFFGADAFSFGSGISLQNGDEMRVKWDGFGRELRNKLKLQGDSEALITVRQL
jgi:hypothetical protein